MWTLCSGENGSILQMGKLRLAWLSEPPKLPTGERGGAETGEGQGIPAMRGRGILALRSSSLAKMELC